MTDGSRAWHALTLGEVRSALRAEDAGLSFAEASERLRRDGPNVLPSRPPPGFLSILLHQFRSPLIYVLLGAAGLSLVIGEATDAAFIAAVLALNAVIGTWQEWSAERGAQALQKLLRTTTVAIRSGQPVEIDAEELVAGDVILVESGNRVPADLRLLEAGGLEVDESLLTGESVPVGRDARWRGDERVPMGDRQNMLHAGSTVARGRGRGLVVATASRTQLGALAADVLGQGGGEVPLIVRMERFARVIAVSVLVASLVVALAGILWRGYAVSEMLLFAVALAVSAIPEGLPVAMTVALSVAMHRMARRRVIVRRLAAVEGLGSCTMIATDKTGTLTRNELTVREIRLPDGSRLEVRGGGFVPEGEILLGGVPIQPGESPALLPLVRAAVLCNEAELRPREGGWTWRGDPTDIALLAAGRKAGWTREAALERCPQVNQIPFEPERRYAATFHRTPEGIREFVKGAPERVIPMCPDAPPDAPSTAAAMAASGLRVLALAEGEGPEGLTRADPAPAPERLRFLGLVGMIDPLREGAREAVEQCRRAGIAVTMVTGDHPVTALAIARDLGLADAADAVVTGVDLEGADPAKSRGTVDRARVFARVAPRQKLEIVSAAQQAGHFVAVTGDGVNDAPALRQANIGVAMGKSGTDVAREAAELVITDDQFSSIVAGVEEGRIAYDNIRKVIYLLISTGAAEVLMAALAVAAGLPVPLLAVQLLWLNLVTNGIQDVALAFEPGEGDSMRRPPRPPRERIFNRLMIERTVAAALVIGGVGFAAFHHWISSGVAPEEARSRLLLLMVLFEIFHIGNCRSETRSVIRMSPVRSPILLAGTLLAFGVHVAAMHLPGLRNVLRIGPLDASTWITLTAAAASVVVVMELHKAWWSARRGGGWLKPAEA